MDTNQNTTRRYPLDPWEAYCRHEGVDEQDTEAREDFWVAMEEDRREAATERY